MSAHRTRSAGSPPPGRPTGAAAARPTALDAFEQARQTFLAGERVDMRALAKTLDVDRATLYRWVGGRVHLLTEILWSLLSQAVEDLRAPGDERDTPPVAAVMTEMARCAISSTPVQRFLEREGDFALRLLTTEATDFEARLVVLVDRLITEDIAAGRLTPAVPAGDLPYILVRVLESYIYLGLITGARPDPDGAAKVINALLPPCDRPPCTPPARSPSPGAK